MNQTGVPVPEHEQAYQAQPMAEIPSYPGAEQEQAYTPGQEVAPAPSIAYEPPKTPVGSTRVEQDTTSAEGVDLYNSPNHLSVPQSQSPELQTDIAFERTRSGEKVFVNPELGAQATYKGGITSQQLFSKVSGYYVVQQGLVSDPKAGLLQQTAHSGDPTNASTWQATILYKILQAFWSFLGVS